MKIAFRKTYAPTFLGRLFNKYTGWKLKTKYFHGGVVVGDFIYQTTKNGLVCEKFTNKAEWDIFETDVSDIVGEKRLMRFVGIRYDVLSLIAFVFPFKFSDARALYCFEVCWLALTGNNPTEPISPDTIMSELLKRAQSFKTNSSAFVSNDNKRLFRDPNRVKF